MRHRPIDQARTDRQGELVLPVSARKLHVLAAERRSRFKIWRRVATVLFFGVSRAGAATPRLVRQGLNFTAFAPVVHLLRQGLNFTAFTPVVRLVRQGLNFTAFAPVIP